MSARHQSRLAVRWSDTDRLGHVNAARYLTFVEDMCAEWFFSVFGDNFVVARMELDFLREVPHGTRSVDAVGWVEKLGTSSFTFATEIRREDGEPAARIRSVAVVWDADARRSRPLTAGERAFLQSSE